MKHEREWETHHADTHTHTHTHTVGLGVSAAAGCRSMETTDWLVSTAEKRIALGPKLLYTLTSKTQTHTHTHTHTAEKWKCLFD